MSDHNQIERVLPFHQRTDYRNSVLEKLKQQHPNQTLGARSSAFYEAIKHLDGASVVELFEYLHIDADEIVQSLVYLQSYGVTVICEQRPLLTASGLNGVVDFYRIADEEV